MIRARLSFFRLRRWQVCLWAALVSLAGSVIAGSWLGEPHAHVHDEFAYLLQARTFAEGRLANPPHPHPDFFQAAHVLVEPTYTGKYPPGHPAFLALGIRLGAPIYGVWIENAVFAASLAWMLLVFLPPRWALLGSLLAVIQLGGLYYWTQSYWITPMAAAGGALVWGGAFALRRRRSVVDGLLLGAGVGFLLLSRPFEGLVACLVPCGVVCHGWFAAARGTERRRLLLEGLLPAALVVAAAFAFLGFYNRAVTGDALRLPYLAYESRHSGSRMFVWQKPAEQSGPRFAAPILNAFQTDYVEPTSRLARPSWESWRGRIWDTVFANLGFVLAPLAVAGAGLAFLRKGGPAWARLAVLSFAASSASLLAAVWFDRYYYMPVLPPLILLAVFALRRGLALLPDRRRGYAWLAGATATGAALCVVLAKGIERSPDFFRNKIPLDLATESLRAFPEKFLILVRVRPPYELHTTYVANAPDIDRSQIVWAWDLGEARNREILDYYPSRRVLLMEVRNHSIQFLPYPQPTHP